MKKIAAFALSLGIFSNLLATDVTVVPYVATSQYKSSSLNNALIGGLYSKFVNPKHTFELNYEKMNANYSTSGMLHKQNDYVFLYSYLLSQKYQMSMGLHLIKSNIAQSDKINIYLFSLKRTSDRNINVGADLSYSYYTADALARRVMQIKPYIGLYFGNSKSNTGTLYTKLSYYLINPLNTSGGILPMYNSFELSLIHKIGDFTNTIYTWSGKQFYGVKENGFAVYNRNELHTGGVGISSRYKVSKNFGAKVSYTSEDFSEIGSNEMSTMERYLLLCDYRF